MGLLSLGTPLPWADVKKLGDHVREHGIYQFLSIWKRNKDRADDPLLWGDEVDNPSLAIDSIDSLCRSNTLWSTSTTNQKSLA